MNERNDRRGNELNDLLVHQLGALKLSKAADLFSDEGRAHSVNEDHCIV